VKKFLRSPLGATSYEGVAITWIRGRTPTLTVKRDGDETETIDLSRYNNADGEKKLDALFASKGLVRKPIDDDMRGRNDIFLEKHSGARPRLRGARLGRRGGRLEH